MALAATTSSAALVVVLSADSARVCKRETFINASSQDLECSALRRATSASGGQVSPSSLQLNSLGLQLGFDLFPSSLLLEDPLFKIMGILSPLLRNL